MPAEIRRSVELWIGCLAGALEESDYRQRLVRAGFEEVSIEPTRVYRVDEARQFLSGHGIDVDAIAPLVDERFFSGFIRARKPVR
jgi:arsenite methyltransferase